MRIEALQNWTPQQRNVVVATVLGWTLDAFDFFLLVFVLKDIAHEFGTDIPKVTLLLMLTLAMRPLGAFVFGRAADHFGRRPTLMINVAIYSALEFVSGFAPNLATLMVLRALYGVAMGGEWGVGSSLTMESIPPHARGFVSGILQAGYPMGYLLASVLYATLFATLGWRGMFMVGVLPALLVLYIRRHVPESPGWEKKSAAEISTVVVVKKYWKLALYAVLLMTAFNFFSHGTQDLYPTFLEEQLKLTPHQVGAIAITYNIGAMLGGIFFGSLSERIGRRKAIIIAAGLALPALPLWIMASTPITLAIGAFIMQFMVQGAWGVIPVHLNELSPEEARATFPGFVYQLGNLLASANSRIQADLAKQYFGGNYAYALGLVSGIVAIVIVLLALVGREAKGVQMGKA